MQEPNGSPPLVANRPAGRLAPSWPSRFDVLLVGGVLLLLLLVAGPVLRIPLHIPAGYNEGWNAGWGTRAVVPGSGPLYPGPDTLVFNNYPPLGFIVVGAAGRLSGDMIIAGRVIATLSWLAAAWFAGSAVRGFGGTHRAAIAAGLLQLLLSATYYRFYVAVDDPQWLALATMLAGLALLPGGGVSRLREGRLLWASIVASALLMVAGGFTKHNLVALPMATGLWLLWLRPRAGLVWIAVAVVAALIGLALLRIAYGSDAWQDIFHHRRVVRWWLWTQSLLKLAPLLPAALAACVLLRRRDAGDGTVFAVLFGAIALPTGIAQRMGDGVYYNAHFETLIAVCIGFGLLLGAAERGSVAWRGRRMRPFGLFVLAVLPVLAAMPQHLPIAWHMVADRHREERAWQPVIARLASARGMAGCQMLSLCYWAGKPFTVDMFNLTQSVLTGGSINRFRTMVLGRDFVLFEVDPTSFLHDPVLRRLGGDPLMALLAERYVALATAPGGVLLLAPRRERAFP